MEIRDQECIGIRRGLLVEAVICLRTRWLCREIRKCKRSEENGGDDPNKFSLGLLDVHAFDTELIHSWGG